MFLYPSWPIGVKMGSWFFIHTGKMMTDWAAKIQAELAFLRDEIVDSEHKIARYMNAITSCRECQEADGLQAMLHTAQEQRDLLDDLLVHQTGENPLSLGSLITLRIETLQNEAARLESGWQHGHSISPTYWQLENKRAFLMDLLRHYHAWESGRPYYPPVVTNGEAANDIEKTPAGHKAYLHPWYIPMPPNSGVNDGEHESEDQSTALNTIQKAVYEQLHQQGFPDNHLKITVQPDSSVFITGYSHSEDERERILKAIGTVPGIRELLAGIQIVDEAHCPVCTLPQNQMGRAE